MMYCYGVRKIQEIIKQKPCEDAQAKFTLNELLLEGQGFRMFLQLKTAVTEKILPGDAQGPMRVTQKSYQMTIDKFKATAFKTIQQDIRAIVISIRIYAGPVMY